jgi:hypothetical protein
MIKKRMIKKGVLAIEVQCPTKSASSQANPGDLSSLVRLTVKRGVKSCYRKRYVTHSASRAEIRAVAPFASPVTSGGIFWTGSMTPQNAVTLR